MTGEMRHRGVALRRALGLGVSGGKAIAPAGITRLAPKPIAEFVKMQMSDALLLSYPKSGRTWLRMALGLCLAEEYGLMPEDPTDLSALARCNGKVPTIRATHDGRPHVARPEELRQKKYAYIGTRIVFLVRDPRDAVISLHYQHRYRDGRDVGDLEDWVRTGAGGLPTAVEFLNSWLRNLELARETVLVTYEGMHRDLRSVLTDVCAFVGVTPAQGTIDKVVERSSFGRMRALEAQGEAREERLQARDVGDVRTYKTRAGKVGGYVDEVSAETRAWMDGYVRDHLAKNFGY